MSHTPDRSSPEPRAPIPFRLLALGLAVAFGSVPAVAALAARALGLATGRSALAADPVAATAALWAGGLAVALPAALLVALLAALGVRVGRR